MCAVVLNGSNGYTVREDPAKSGTDGGEVAGLRLFGPGSPMLVLPSPFCEPDGECTVRELLGSEFPHGVTGPG